VSGFEVLVVGAGPTGLVLALWLTRLGVAVRIIDKAAEAGTTSRALVVHARTLELYDQLGIADDIVAQGIPMAAANLWVSGRKIQRAPFGEIGKGLSPFPFALAYAQDAHERFLEATLAREGVTVERNTELVGFEDLGDRVRASVRGPRGEETEEVAYLAGCDGAHSTVRKALKVEFPGGTYDHVFYVADVTATGPVMNRELHVALDSADFIAIFPLGATHGRLVGIVKDEAVPKGAALGWDDVSKDVLDRLGIAVKEVHWFSIYRVHHRVANAFRMGRAFLLGDAAHIHSPVGGQGMNTGIGDAVNLSWKLAWVLHGGADPKVLDTYQCERRAFAKRLVATTDNAFTFATQDGPIARFVRLRVFPVAARMLFTMTWTRRLMFRTVSQINVNYRGCDLSAGHAGRVRGGDRLPWVSLGEGRGNFHALRSLRWQVHVYGERTDEVARYCEERKFELHVFPWRPEMGEAGFARNAIYLVRPDGYVASASQVLPAKAGSEHFRAGSIEPLT
jgi:2-polyprenyl-6-methoxyphenol hydroxylase-like FAD-dependent oxidoreductase